MLKKILVILMMGSTLNAQPYISLGGSFSNADERHVECRVSAVGVLGLELSEYASVEGRYSYGLNGDYTSYGIYIKPTYQGFYALIGSGVTNYNDTDFDGGRYGLGYQFNLDGFKVFTDVIYRDNEEDTALTIGVSYNF